MKIFNFILLFLLIAIPVKSQVIQTDTTKMGYVLTEKDDILNDTIKLEEIVVYKEKLSPEDVKQFLILQNRVYKTYPYAKLASERLTVLNKGMSSLSTNKEKKIYFKIIENYLSAEFEAKLKKLSRKQGQILVKLIYRQTGTSTYDLVRNLKSGWKAFWSNTTASMFDINLKTKYAPFEVNEDYWIETILVRAFYNGRLLEQKPVNSIDYDELTTSWSQKSKTLKAN
jgi:hypothetical protein